MSMNPVMNEVANTNGRLSINQNAKRSPDYTLGHNSSFYAQVINPELDNLPNIIEVLKDILTRGDKSSLAIKEEKIIIPATGEVIEQGPWKLHFMEAKGKGRSLIAYKVSMKKGMAVEDGKWDKIAYISHYNKDINLTVKDHAEVAINLAKESITKPTSIAQIAHIAK